MPLSLSLPLRLLLLLAALVASPARAEPPSVVASIKPIHSLVAGVMRGVGEPVLLIRGAASPHGYSLRPSEARALSRAELVVWVGPGLETFLVQALETLGRDARVLTLAGAPGVRLLETRAGGAWERHRHEEEVEAHESEPQGHDGAGEAHADHDHGNVDPHLWLDPENGRAIVRAVSAALQTADPDNGAAYAANAARLDARLEALDRRLKETLAPVRGAPYVVFHDAYHYFEARFGLNAVGSVTVSPETPPGARRLAAIRARIGTLGARCVFAEPQFEPALVRTVVEGTSARVGTLDPVGAALEPGAALYFELLEGLGEDFTGCMAGAD
jgi:zinc transport system substrate-binding protein